MFTRSLPAALFCLLIPTGLPAQVLDGKEIVEHALVVVDVPEESGMDVKIRSGKRKAEEARWVYDDATTWVRQRRATVDDLKEGDLVHVSGTMAPDQSRLAAQRVAVVFEGHPTAPEEEEGAVYMGTLKRGENGTWLIETSAGSVVLELGESVRVMRRDIVEEKPELYKGTPLRTFRRGEKLVLVIVAGNKD